jgi:putative membrane protein
MSLEALTRVSTACIVASGVCLLLGWFLIRVPRRVAWHRNVMLLATTFAGAFLAAYVARWALYGTKPFAGTGAWRTIYFGILIPHVILAIAVGPLAVRLIRLALVKRDFVAHRRLARITLPIWLYVAASGWMIYYMLYRMQFESAGG